MYRYTLTALRRSLFQPFVAWKTRFSRNLWTLRALMLSGLILKVTLLLFGTKESLISFLPFPSAQYCTYISAAVSGLQTSSLLLGRAGTPRPVCGSKASSDRPLLGLVHSVLAAAADSSSPLLRPLCVPKGPTTLASPLVQWAWPLTWTQEELGGGYTDDVHAATYEHLD